MTLIADFRIHPLAIVQILLGVAEIEALNVEVLNVGPRVGHAPGDMFIVTNDDEGQAGKADAGYIEPGRFEMNHVPDAGDAVAKMGIVRQQRLAGFRVRSIHNPVIAPQPARRFHCRLGNNASARRLSGRGFMIQIYRLLFSDAACSEVGTSATGTSSAEWSGNTSEKRSFPNLAAICSRIKSLSQLWLSAVARFKADSHGIDFAPGLGLVSQQEKFQGQAVAMAFDEGIDAAGIRIKKTALVRGKVGEGRLPPLVESPGCGFRCPCAECDHQRFLKAPPRHSAGSSPFAIGGLEP